MNPGNKELARSTANQTPGMMTRRDVARKLGSWAPQGAALTQSPHVHGRHSLRGLTITAWLLSAQGFCMWECHNYILLHVEAFLLPLCHVLCSVSLVGGVYSSLGLAESIWKEVGWKSLESEPQRPGESPQVLTYKRQKPTLADLSRSRCAAWRRGGSGL